jgi:diguanylate cyclase (GGDEF)-like protein
MAANGRTIGYFVWSPFRPGHSVMSLITPTLLAALAIVCVGISMLLRRLLGSSLDLQASEAQAQHLAFHDTLTGLANRALFEDRLEHALAIARRDKHPVALLYLDLDRFKKVNDTQGHSAGDALIRMVGQRLIGMTRASDTVARLGGDEFAIILGNSGSVADIEMLGQRMIAAIAEPFDLDGGIADIGVSIGIAIAPIHGTDRAELSRKADIALYDAKANGRGRCTVFADEMDEDIRFRQRIEQELRHAMLRHDELMLHYQPIIDSRTGSICGVEALTRWNNPALGMVPPGQFIPIAEESGLIEQLGDWVLQHACNDAHAWQLETIAVNISPIQLRSPGFAQRALAIVDGCGFDPRRLELEITETCLIDSAEECQPNIAALRARGVRLALDDFGTGYSSFNHFRQLKVDRLKIDRSFVSAITPEAPESAIIKAILDLAASAGIDVTAEGVETAQQSRYLASAGCVHLQGWFHGRAQPADSITELLRIAPRRRDASAA